MQKSAIALCSLALLYAGTALGQDTLSHQGRLLDAAGGAIEGEHTLTFTITDDAGSALYMEAADLTLFDGYYTVVLGQSTPLPESVSAEGRRRIAIAVDGVPMGPASLIGATPSAMRATRADVANNVSGDITPTSVTLAGGITVLRASGAVQVGATTIQPSGAIEVAGNVVVTASGSLPMDGQECPSGQVLAGFAGDGSLICRTIAAVPSGLIGFFAGECPSGFEAFDELAGRTIVGTTTGDVELGVGAPLSNGGLRQITQVPAHGHLVNPPSTTSSAIANHAHTVDPPNTSTGQAGNHAHTVDPPNTSTTTTGSHRHAVYAPVHDVNNSSSQGYPNGDNHQSFRSTDRARQRTIASAAMGLAGNHAHTVNIGSFGSSTTGNHLHSLNIGSFQSATAGGHAHTTDIPVFQSEATGASSVDVTDRKSVV